MYIEKNHLRLLENDIDIMIDSFGRCKDRDTAYEFRDLWWMVENDKVGDRVGIFHRNICIIKKEIHSSQYTKMSILN